MRSSHKIALAPLLIMGLFVLSTSVEAGFTVNGILSSDWSVHVADNNASNINGYLGMPGVVGHHSEDQDDLAGNGAFLGPNTGGQNYDAEFLGVAVETGRLFLTIVSGQRPDNGFLSAGKGLYAPGDIRIVTKLGGATRTFGIEVGGGAVSGTGSAITEGAEGSTYSLDGNGYTTGHTSHATGQVAGSMWLDPTWINDPITPFGPTQLQMTGGTYVGLTDYYFSRNSLTTQHSIIEVGIDLGLFAGAEIQGVFWRPSCGNDELNVSGMNLSTPEPASLVLAGVGMLGCCAGYWRRPRLQPLLIQS